MIEPIQAEGHAELSSAIAVRVQSAVPVFALLLIAGLVGGALARRVLRLPRIVGYVIGPVLGTHFGHTRLISCLSY